MAKMCDYYCDRHSSKYWCLLKEGEVSSETYKEYCKNDDCKNCPIYKHYSDKKGCTK